MKLITLHPSQIMTTNDFPVHNEQILKIYFKICQKKHIDILPPLPVYHKSLGLPLLGGSGKDIKKHNIAIKSFFEENPGVEYILMDGSHKTTALTLTHNLIPAIVIKTNQDVKKFHKMEETGEIFSFAGPFTMKEIFKDKAEHFFEADFFQTVESKTKRMVEAKVIPQFMINHYKSK
ncbi:hypothetical protein KKC60_03920 [Patescibacteria group bacterium]|nr:hypothetical protein [Patescibacteria group bacterium]